MILNRRLMAVGTIDNEDFRGSESSVCFAGLDGLHALEAEQATPFWNQNAYPKVNITSAANT